MLKYKTPIKIYGPYLHKKRKQPRLFVILIYKDKTTKTTQYARYLMEEHLQRNLTKKETINHIDENPLNNDLSNLEILSGPDNSKKYYINHPTPTTTYNCSYCNKENKKETKNIKGKLKKGYKNLYCNKKCYSEHKKEKNAKNKTRSSSLRQ